ncbi:helix-turn-helix transcriptional regulator [Microlunatus sp. Y2014]|uniref:helix-turn-helix transcriptional regulator n=1 Tax=Microlunatus sp. Y2014 TaxID=3418488 RepID=UPI003DA7955B
MREPLLTIEEAAERTRLSVNTLRFLRREGRGPKSGKLGRRIFFRQADLDAWIDAAFDTEAV